MWRKITQFYEIERFLSFSVSNRVGEGHISQNEMNAFVDVVVRNLATKRNVERIAAKLISILNESETDEIGFIVDRVKNCNKSD